ncbi:hypothetical protein CR513_33045, partial [Mucuna pruriens]
MESLPYVQIYTRSDITFVLRVLGYQDSKCSTSRYIYMLVGGVIFWKSVKQNSTMVVEFVAYFEVVNRIEGLLKMYCDNCTVLKMASSSNNGTRMSRAQWCYQTGTTSHVVVPVYGDPAGQVDQYTTPQALSTRHKLNSSSWDRKTDSAGLDRSLLNRSYSNAQGACWRDSPSGAWFCTPSPRGACACSALQIEYSVSASTVGPGPITATP